jgi:hypothetical protein
MIHLIHLQNLRVVSTLLRLGPTVVLDLVDDIVIEVLDGEENLDDELRKNLVGVRKNLEQLSNPFRRKTMMVRQTLEPITGL